MTSTAAVTAQTVFDSFFVQAIENGRLAHAYILKGRNSAGLYQRALDVARILNCQKAGDPAESCAPDAPGSRRRPIPTSPSSGATRPCCSPRPAATR